MYKIEDIKIIPYVRFQTPDGALHDTIKEALAHKPPICKPGEYAMWCRCCSTEKYSYIDDHSEAILVYISNNEAASAFEEDCELYEASSDGLAGPGWYAWDYSERVWMPIPDYIGENLVRE